MILILKTQILKTLQPKGKGKTNKKPHYNRLKTPDKSFIKLILIYLSLTFL